MCIESIVQHPHIRLTMPRFLLIAYLLFLTGIAFKMFRLPFASLILVVAVLLMLVQSVLYFSRNIKTNAVQSLFYLAVAVSLVYVTFRIQYWPTGRHPFGPSTVYSFVTAATLAYVVVFIVKKQRVNFKFIFILALFGATFYLTTLPVRQVHYALYLNGITYNEGRKSNFIDWHKYSWFLYSDGMFDEALEANQMAIQELKKVLEIESSEHLLQNQRQLEEVENLIRSRSWKNHEGLSLVDYN